MPYIIVSEKKQIRAISQTNNDIDFHNKLFDTDDCVITWEADPTPEEIEALKKSAELAAKERPKEKTLEERVKALEEKLAEEESGVKE